MKFSRAGIGSLYGATFEAAFAKDNTKFPYGRRGRSLFMAADFSGQSYNQKYEVYSFLFLDLDQNNYWLELQRNFRSTTPAGQRRMSFKGLNDNKKKLSLRRFLQVAGSISGSLVTIAVPKSKVSLFEAYENTGRSEPLSAWKPKTREHVKRILHFSAYFAAAFSMPGQDFMWFIDEDSCAANDVQLTQMTGIFGNLISHYLSHDLRHIRCGTSRNDNGSLQLEDLLAVPDLVAGTIAEVASGFQDQGYFPAKGLTVPLPRKLSAKSLMIASWLSDTNTLLRQEVFFWEPNKLQKGSRLTHIRVHPINPHC
jgi:hypothetical protein